MSDVNANIGVHIDTSSALTELKALQKQLALFHGSVSKGSAAAASAQAGLQQNLLNSINATGKFSARMGVVRTSTESFTHALEKNKLTMGQYFKYAGASTKTFGKMFKSEFDTIGKVAEERVKKMQTQYIKMGRDASGAMRAMSITPNTINMKDYGVQTAIAAQKQALFNQLVRQGSTNLLNFGKNTQWAGRQLMVGFTVPLMYFGSAAAKVFMDLEKQTIKFKRVYGDMFTTPAQADKALEDIQKLADEYTKYGVQVTKTIEMAAQAAAMGKTGAELTAQVANATKLAVLGSVEQEQALETTISLTNAFGIAAEDLTQKINFLNAVENQTTLSIEDLTIAIPKAGPVIKQLGGEVEDLAFFMTAMKEGGINASEGANALKSGLASMINPSKKASEMLAGLGINLKGIVEANKGDLKATVIGFAQALDTLDPLNRARAIEQLFGKFQFARLSTLFQNITKDGTQAAKTLQLAGASVEELAILSERELKTVEDAVGTNFKEAIEQLKVSIAPIGKEFLKAVTPIVKFVGSLLEKFNGLSDGTKKFIVIATSLVGIVGPVLLMTFGLLANGAANIIKLFLAMRQGFMRLGGNSKLLAEQTTYLNSEQLEAATVAASLGQAHSRLTQQFQIEAGAVRALRQAYIEATVAAARFAATNPGMMAPGARGPRGGAPRKYAKGVTMVPGTGTGDTVPAMLTPGEGVVPADVMKDERAQALVGALISGKLFGYNDGTTKAGKTNFTHVGGKQDVDITRLLEDPSLSKDDRARLTFLRGLLESEGADTVAKKYHALGFTFDDKKNIAMSEGGISYADFEAEWDRQGYRKWEPSGILELDAIDFDNELKAKVRELSSGSNTVTDDIVERAFKELSPAMKESSVYRKALKNYEAFNEYEVKRGIPSPPDKLKGALTKAAASDKIPNLDVIEVDGDPFKVTLKNGETRVEFDEEIKNPKYRNKHVLVTRTDSSGKKVVSSFWGTPALGEEHVSFNRLGKSKRFKVGEVDDSGKKISKKEKSYNPKEQETIDKASENLKNSSIKKQKETDLGRKIGNNPGRSFGVEGVGGFYEKPDGTRVFAKPVLSETAALAEIRATQIARDVHGLDTPLQKMIVMKDPVTGARIIGLESPMEERFTPKMMTGQFSKEDYFKQTVAAALRGDADLAPGNMSGKILTDVGPAGVFSSASGNDTYATSMRSMEDQARIFLQEAATQGEDGKAINRKTAFRKSTLDMVKNMSADDYHRMMIAEIDDALPKLRKLVADPKFVTDADRPVYEAMIRRLEEGRNVDWRKLHESHTGIVVQKGEALQDKKTGKITPIKGEKKPNNVKADSGDVKDNILTAKPPKGSEVVKTRKPRKSAAPKKSAAPRVIRPGRADAPYANPYVGMSDDQKRIEKSIRRQSEKLQKERMAALKLEQRELRAQEAIKRKIAKSRGEAHYNRFAGSGMTPDQIAVAKSIQRKRGTQGQIGPYANSGMTQAEISKARRDEKEAVRVRREQDAKLRRENQQIATRAAAEKRAEDAKRKKQEYKKSPEFKQQRMMRMQGVGMAAGMASSAAYMTGNTGIGNALMGVSVLATLGPMLANPLALASAAVVAFTGGLLVAQSINKKTAQKQSRLIDETSATTEKMKSIGELTNKVGASEIYARKRQTSVADRYTTGFERGKQQFGATFLESEVGKSVFAGFNKDLANGGEEAVKKISLQLSAYVSDGIMTAEQAHSVASQIGINLNNQTLISQISGQMLDLIGPNGEDLLKDPLTVRMNLVSEQIATTSITPEQAAAAGLPSYDVSSDDDIAEAANAYFDDWIAMVTETGPEKIGAALGGSFAQAFEFNQAQADSFSKYYDDQIAILEKQKLQTTELSKQKTITDQISKLEEKRQTGLDSFKTNAKTILDNVGSALGALNDSSPGTNALKEASRTQLQDKYKGTGQELQAVVLEEKTKTLDTLLQVQINAIAGSGIIGPQALTNMIGMFGTDTAGQEELSKNLEIAITKHDPGMVENLLQQLGGLDGEVGRKIFVNLIKEDPKEFDKLASTIALIQKMAGKEINIEAFFSQKDAVKKLKELQIQLEKVEALEGPITPKVIATIDIDGNAQTNDMEALLGQWDKWKNLPDSTKKTVIQEYIALYKTIGEGDVDAAIAKEKAGMPEHVQNFINQKYDTPEEREALKGTIAADRVMQVVKQEQAFSKGGLPDPNDPTETKARDTTLDDLLKKLKLTRDASINAEGGINELRRAFKKAAGDIKVFNGVNQQLRKLYGADSGFIDFIGGMDNATEKGYVNAAKLKKGVVELTGDGVKAMQLYKEAQLGAFGDAANEAILQAQKQRNGFVSLKSAGASSADALEMVADANFMVSLSAAKTQKEVKGLIDLFKAQRKEEEILKATTNPLEYFNDQKSVMDEKFNVDERNIRAQYEPQIELQQKLIDLENEYIREKQYEMETNEEINTARLDQINSEIDALQHSMQVGIDKQLAGLSDESARYSEDIAIMNHTIESINEQYDIQEKALSRVNDINQEIIDKQKSQISLADALTSGDISAAAQAENAMRAQAAKSMATTASQNLASAREAAINGVTSASGMTMDQIQERQYQIDRTTYGLNMQKKRIEDEIAVKQEEVYQINLKRKKITDEIRGHEQAIYDLNNGPGGMADLQSEMNMYLGDVKFMRGEWEDAQLAIDNATVNAEDFRAKVEKAEGLVNDINTYWNGIEDEKTLTVTIKKIEEIVKSYAPEKTAAEIKAEKIAQYRHNFVAKAKGKSDAEIAKILGLAKGGVVPKYFSVGGAARGTDIIPAMLTPGEFVVNAKSAQAAGPLLAAINSPSFNGFKAPQMSGVTSNSAAASGSSMYNYSVGINVNQSNASADDIAKAVMTQIKYVDSQRIRGQR